MHYNGSIGLVGSKHMLDPLPLIMLIVKTKSVPYMSAGSAVDHDPAKTWLSSAWGPEARHRSYSSHFSHHWCIKESKPLWAWLTRSKLRPGQYRSEGTARAHRGHKPGRLSPFFSLLKINRDKKRMCHHYSLFSSSFTTALSSWLGNSSGTLTSEEEGFSLPVHPDLKAICYPVT